MQPLTPIEYPAGDEIRVAVEHFVGLGRSPEQAIEIVRKHLHSQVFGEQIMMNRSELALLQSAALQQAEQAELSLLSTRFQRGRVQHQNRVLAETIDILEEAELIRLQAAREQGRLNADLGLQRQMYGHAMQYLPGRCDGGC
jgi:hypothetical protein